MSGSYVRKRIWTGNNGAGDGGGGSDSFNGERPITRNTPGIIGFNPDSNTIDEFLEAVFYPAVPPICAISVNNPVREIGQSPDYTLSWAVTQQTNLVESITVDGTDIDPVTGNDQDGTQDGALPNAYGNYTKSMTAEDTAALTSSASCTVQYLPRVFWGTTAKDGLSDAPILDADILALSNSNLQATRDLTLSNFGGGDTYLIFAFPSSYGTPSFVVNGLANTAFTKVRAASNFVNAQGATIVMDVWVSNFSYNSPLASVIVN
jgi:hypothetical protein